MVICPNENSPEYREMFDVLKATNIPDKVAHELVYAFWEKNNYNPVTLAPNGEPGNVYNTALKLTGDKSRAVMAKLRTLRSGFQEELGTTEMDVNGEPVIEGTKIIGKDRVYSLVYDQVVEKGLSEYNRETGGKIELPAQAMTRILNKYRKVGNILRDQSVTKAIEDVHRYNAARRSLGFPQQLRVIKTAVGWKIEKYDGEGYFSFDDPHWMNNAFANMNEYIRGYMHSLEINKAKNPQMAPVIEQQLKDMDDLVEGIEKGFNYEALSQLAHKEMDKVESSINRGMTFTDMKNAYISLSVWDEAFSILIPTEEATGDSQAAYMLSQVKERASRLQHAVEGEIVSGLSQYSKEKMSRFVPEQDFKHIQEMGAGKSLFLDGSHSISRAVQMLHKILADAVRTSQVEHFDYMKELDGHIKNLKKSKLWKKQRWDPILQQNKEDEWTGGYLLPLSKEWYSTLAELREKAENTKKRGPKKRAWEAYWEFKEDNEIVLHPGILYESDADGNLVDKDTPQAKSLKARLIDDVGQDHAELLLKESRRRYSKFLQERRDFDVVMETEVAKKYENQDDVLDMKERWLNNHDPVRHLKRRAAGRYKVDASQNRAWRYYVATPKKKGTEWFDTRYEQLMNDPAYAEYKEFYIFMMESMKKFTDYIPDAFIEGINSNFLPEVSSNFWEKLSEKGVMKSIQEGLFEQYDGLFEDVHAVMSKAINPSTGKPYDRIPLKYLKTTLSPEERTKDVAVMLQIFSGMAINYKYASEAEDPATLLQSLINNASEIKETSQGPVVNAKNLPVTFGKSLANTKESVNYMVDAMLYGKRRTDTGRLYVEAKLDDDKRAELESILEKSEEVTEELEAGDITYEEWQRRIGPLAKKAQKIAGKDLVPSRIADRFLILTQIKGMAFNPFAASANLGFGILSNTVHAAGGEDFSTKDLMKAMGMMGTSIFKAWTGNRININKEMANKISNLMGRFNVLFEVNEAKYGKQKYTAHTRLNLPSEYFMQTGTEFIAQGMTMVAMMLREKVSASDTISGKEISLWEVYNPDGTVDRSLVKEEIAQEMEDPSSNFFRKFQNKVIQVNKKIHGNYDITGSPIRAKKTVTGRLAMQFRTWIPEGVANRFEAQRYDEYLGRDTKGRYLSYVELFKEQKAGGMLTMLKGFIRMATLGYLFPQAFNGLTDVDKANMQKNMAELGLAVIFLGVAKMLSLGTDDDDDDLRLHERFLNIILNATNRVESDIWFYVNPTTFEEITQNPIPVMRTGKDILKALQVTISAPFDPDIETEYIFNKWIRASPYVNLYPKYQSYSSQVY